MRACARKPSGLGLRWWWEPNANKKGLLVPGTSVFLSLLMRCARSSHCDRRDRGSPFKPSEMIPLVNPRWSLKQSNQGRPPADGSCHHWVAPLRAAHSLMPNTMSDLLDWTHAAHYETPRCHPSSFQGHHSMWRCQQLCFPCHTEVDVLRV